MCERDWEWKGLLMVMVENRRMNGFLHAVKWGKKCQTKSMPSTILRTAPTKPVESKSLSINQSINHQTCPLAIERATSSLSSFHSTPQAPSFLPSFSLFQTPFDPPSPKQIPAIHPSIHGRQHGTPHTRGISSPPVSLLSLIHPHEFRRKEGLFKRKAADEPFFAKRKARL